MQLKFCFSLILRRINIPILKMENEDCLTFTLCN